MSFDIYAKNWDTEARIIRAKVVADEIMNSVKCDQTCSAMEFGCGTGLVSFNLLNRFRHITMIDSSQTMIDIAKRKQVHYNASGMVTHHLDLTTDHEFAETYDLIYNSMVLHHVVDTFGIIQKLFDCLNDDGELCIIDLDAEDGSFHRKYPEFDGHNGFDQEGLKQVLVDVGFLDVVSHTFYHGQKIFEGETMDYSLFIMTGRRGQ